MMKRSFLMLAHVFKPEKHGIGGWFLSDKLDGQRAFWDGGISRGILKSEVPWANCDKDERLKTEQISTGLWTRLGNVMHAPDWWLNKLPKVMLDGELWHGVLGDGERQNLRKIVGKHTPDGRWKTVKFYVFGLPARCIVFMDGRVKEGNNFLKIFKGIDTWHEDVLDLDYDPNMSPMFIQAVKKMKTLKIANSVVIIHPQTRLPHQTEAALKIIEERLEAYVSQGGEGLILRKAESRWFPKRLHELLKVKKRDDDEGIVVGYTCGRRTDKGSKLLGLMGALILDYKGKRLELSGFTDAERRLEAINGGKPTAREWAEEHPGQEVPDWIEASEFPRGSEVTFRYRGMSLDGIPTEASYWRHH